MAATAHPVGTPLRVALVPGAVLANMVGSAAPGLASTITLATVGAGTPPLLVIVPTVALLKRTHVIAGAERALTPAACVPALVVLAATLVVQRNDYREVEDVRKRVGCRLLRCPLDFHGRLQLPSIQT
jgi:hypothetical protein